MKFDLRQLKDRYNLTGAKIALLTGTTPRTVRGWLSPIESGSHVEIPVSCWRLLKILTGAATPAMVLNEINQIHKNAIEKKRFYTKTLDVINKNGKPCCLKWVAQPGRYVLCVIYPDGQSVRVREQPGTENFYDIYYWAEKNGFVPVEPLDDTDSDVVV